MEDIFELLVALIAIIVGVIVKSQKSYNRSEAAKQRLAAAEQARKNYARSEAAAEEVRTMQSRAAAAPQHAAPVLTPADIPGQVVMPIVPTVHPHIEPDCETHDAPGSLGVATMEGKDPCHEEQLTMERAADEPAPAEGGLTFDWSGQNMVKAFVLQEVLTRSAQRMQRRAQ